MSLESSKKGTPAQNKVIPITSLGAAELKGLRERVEEDIERLSNSKIQLQRILLTFESCKSAIQNLKESLDGQEVLLPLSSSLYVTGALKSTNQILMDIGTGYFVEKNCDEGIDYCNRKAENLDKSISELDKALDEKHKIMSSITQVLSEKLDPQKDAK